MTVLVMYRIRSGIPTSADQGSILIHNSTGALVIPETIVTPAQPGIYTYTTNALGPDRYTATWKFVAAGLPDEIIERAFQIDPVQEITDGVTLMDLERLVARRIGPYRRLRVGLGSSVTTISVPRLKTSVGYAAPEDMSVLRRGLTWGDEVITNFTPEDRVRSVASYMSDTGLLGVDRLYLGAPLDGEAIELFPVDPDDLRSAVQDGLRRCFFWDTAHIQVTGLMYNLNVSASLPWVTSVNQINQVSFSYPSQLQPPQRVQWWEAYQEGKAIKLWSRGSAIGSVTFQMLRPYHTYVNGEASLTGPNDDLDVVYVDRDYGAWAGVLECWKNFPEFLQPLTNQKMRPSRDDAAAEFTKKSLTLLNRVPEYVKVDYGHVGLDQIGNLPEPVN